MDFISASKQNLSQGHPSADAGADGGVFGGFDPSATDASYDKSSCRSHLDQSGLQAQSSLRRPAYELLRFPAGSARRHRWESHNCWRIPGW